ncbi:MAG: NIPSNAP family protein [Maricaulaceae bacterium]|jgi:hypothetical protein
MTFRMLGLAAALALVAACETTTPAQGQPAAPVEGRVALPETAQGAARPVRNLAAAETGEEIVTIRYWKIQKGSFPEFLEASQTGVWPYFEKIGARVIGMWLVVPGPDQEEASAEYDEVYLATRYASLAHWEATRDAVRLGGDGEDYRALQAALATRRALTLETNVQFLQGATGPFGPYFLPGTGETFVPAPTE